VNVLICLQACWGGSLIFSQKYRQVLNGIDRLVSLKIVFGGEDLVFSTLHLTTQICETLPPVFNGMAKEIMAKRPTINLIYER